jgi:hypothetical protein
VIEGRFYDAYRVVNGLMWDDTPSSIMKDVVVVVCCCCSSSTWQPVLYFIKLSLSVLSTVEYQGLAEKMLSWLAGSADTHIYLHIDVFCFYSTRAVG